MLFILLAMICFVFQSLGNKEYAAHFPSGMPGLALFNALSLTLVTVAFAALGGVKALPGPALALAIAFGCIFVAYICISVKAMAAGPLSLTQLIINLSMVIPLLVSVFLWQERLTWMKGVGIACMVAVMVLASGKGGEGKGFRWHWLALTLLAMVGSGSMSVLQKAFERGYTGSPVMPFLFWCFLTSAVLSWLWVALCALRKADFTPYRSKRLAASVLLMGLGTAGGNGFVMQALTQQPAVVVFPMALGGAVLAVWAFAALRYRERVTLKTVATMAVGLAGLVLLAI